MTGGADVKPVLCGSLQPDAGDRELFRRVDELSLHPNRSSDEPIARLGPVCLMHDQCRELVFGGL